MVSSISEANNFRRFCKNHTFNQGCVNSWLVILSIEYGTYWKLWINSTTKFTKISIQRIFMKQQYLRASSGSGLYGLWRFFVFIPQMQVIDVLVRCTSSLWTTLRASSFPLRRGFSGIKVSFGSTVSLRSFSLDSHNCTKCPWRNIFHFRL